MSDQEGSPSSRGRGRGRGRPTTLGHDTTSYDEEGPRASSSSLTPATFSTPFATSNVSSVLRPNDYTRSTAPKMKFRPNVARANRVEVKDEPMDVPEKILPSFSNPQYRERNRNRPPIEMTASGPLALGPATAPKPATSRRRGGGQSTVKDDNQDTKMQTSESVQTSPAVTLSKESKSDSKPSKTQLTIFEDEEVRHPSKRDKTFQSLATEDDDAPLLPSIDSSTRSRKTLPPTLPPDSRSPSVTLDLGRSSPIKPREPKVKIESDVHNDMMQDLLSQEPSAEQSREGSVTFNPFANEDQNVKTDPLNLEDSDPYLIFQFPRNFPKFRDPANVVVPSIVPITTNGNTEDVKPEVKVDSNTITEASATETYAKGKWEGWGKRSTRIERPLIGSEDTTLQGQIGKLRRHQSGKMSLVMESAEGSYVYDILPGAHPSFLQEIAALAPKEHELYNSVEPADVDGDHSMDVDEVTSAPPALVVLGQVNRKLILRPNIERLLVDLQIQKEIKLAQLKTKKEQDLIDFNSHLKDVKPSTGKSPTKRTPKAKNSDGKVSTNGSTRGRGRGKGKSTTATATA